MGAFARSPLRNAVVASATVLGGAAAAAQTTVVLPDTSQTTTVSVTVSEQVRVSVPSGVAFNVTDVGVTTLANAVSVTLGQIVLTSATQQVRVSLRANSGGFTPPVAGATTWVAGDVAWNAASWTNGTGTGGTLSQASYNTVATCDPATTSCSTTGLLFSLSPKPAVQRSGVHTLIVTWKLESIGT